MSEIRSHKALFGWLCQRRVSVRQICRTCTGVTSAPRLPAPNASPVMYVSQADYERNPLKPV